MLRHSDAGSEVPTTFVDHEVVDPTGEKLGTVADVIPDVRTLEPRWLVVTSGMLKHAHFVPVEGAVAGDDGAIVVPYDKQMVQHAVRANKDHVLTPEDDRELSEYYGLN